MKNLLHDSLGIVLLLVLRGGGMLALFFVNVVVARNYGTAALGLFQIALAMVMLAATVARFGQDKLMLRVAAEAKADNNAARAHESGAASLLIAGLALILVTAVIVGVLKLNVIEGIDADGITFLSLMAFSIIPTGILMIVTETMRGWQRVNLAMTWQGTVPQILTLALVTFATLVAAGNVYWIALCYAFSFTVAAICAYLAWIKLADVSLTRPQPAVLKKMFSGGTAFWLYSVLTALVAWLDVIVIQAISDVETVGTYTSVIRTGAIFGTIVQVVSAGVVAKLAVSYAKSDYQGFADQFRRFFYLFIAAAIPLGATAIFFANDIMAIWGDGHSDRSVFFRTYAAFQILNFCLCLTGFSAAIMHLEKQLVAIQILTAIVKLALIFVFYKFYGIEGALWGAGLSLVLFNLFTCKIFFQRLKDKGISASAVLFASEKNQT